MTTTELIACTCKPYEHTVPPNRFMLDQPFMTLSYIHVEETDEDIDTNTILFLEGGSQVWVDKENDIVWVWYCSRQNGRAERPIAYKATRRPCTCTKEP